MLRRSKTACLLQHSCDTRILINIIVNLPLLCCASSAGFCHLSINPLVELLYWYEVNPEWLSSLLVRPDAVVESRSNARCCGCVDEGDECVGADCVDVEVD